MSDTGGTIVVSPPMESRKIAAYLKVPESTLSRWHSAGQGPPFPRLGGVARCRIDAVDVWLAGLKHSYAPEGRATPATATEAGASGRREDLQRPGTSRSSVISASPARPPAHRSQLDADAGIPLHVLQDILGHASVETTRGRVHPDDRHLASAAEQANAFLV